jgi:hypothetical protein
VDSGLSWSGLLVRTPRRLGRCARPRRCCGPPRRTAAVGRARAANQGSMMRPARASKPDGYLLGSYRIATAPEPNSSRLTSFKSTCFDSPANRRRPVAREPGMHHELVLIDQSQLRQRQWELHTSHEQSLARLPLELLNGLVQIPAHEFRVPNRPARGCSTRRTSLPR